MDDAETSETRLRSLRDAGKRIESRDARWRRGGLAAGAAAALLIAWATLTPVTMPSLHSAGWDKVAHFLGFAVMVFPVILTDPRRWFWAVPLAIAYGGLIELVQPSVGRSGEWLDWGADVSGVLAGAALAELLHDRLHARMIGSVETPADDDAPARTEAERAALIEDLRKVLREELAVIRRPGEVPQDTQTRPQGPARDDLRH